MELRDAHAKFEQAGVKLYAISYDDGAALKAFSDNYEIPYPLLSDVDSAVIRRYGVLNTEIAPGEIPVYGVCFPGSFVCDEAGEVVAKSFYDTYKRRDSAEILLDDALEEMPTPEGAVTSGGGDAEIRIIAFLHGGRGSLRQGIQRRLIVRFELAEGLHLYGEPVPEGMQATAVCVTGPPGLITETPILPPTKALHLDALDLDLQVWSGVVEFAIPLYPTSELVSECRPLDREDVEIDVRVDYQACDDRSCLPPRSEQLQLRVPLEPVDMPNLSFHGETGQRKARMRGAPHMRRLVVRQLRRHPLAALRSIVQQFRMQRAARRRQRNSKAQLGQ